MDKQNARLASGIVSSQHRSNAKSTMNLRNGRQRQIDELYDLYDLAMIECLLKRPSSLDSSSGV